MKKNTGKKSTANVSIAGSQTSFGNQTKTGLRTSKSTFYGAGSRRNVAIDERSQKSIIQKAPVQVFDELGKDVTPKSLLQGDPNSQRKNQSSMMMMMGDSSSIGTPSELASQSIYGASYAQGFTRSMMGSMIGGSSRISIDSITDEITEPSHTQDFSTGLTDITTRRQYIKEELSEADLDKMVTFQLSETDTIWHFDLPGVSVSRDTELAEEVKMRNGRYEEMLKNRAGNDMYVHRGMQTYNNAPKSKELQTSAVGKEDFGCMATNWDLYDTYAKEEKKTEDSQTDDLLESLSRPSSPKGNQATETLPTVIDGTEVLASLQKSVSVNSLMTESRASFMTTSNTSDTGDMTERESVSQANMDLQAEKVLKTDSMKKNLFTIERAIVQNVFHPKQAVYRGLAALSDSPKDIFEEKDPLEAKQGPVLSRLWAYSCHLTKGKKVNCMIWNKSNQALLAVGYGNFGSGSQEEGLVCCWSLKNPEFPERTYHLQSAVTSLDFSTGNPSLLAVGLSDGTISVFNVRHTNSPALLDNWDNIGKQASPIWQLRWVDRDRGAAEAKGGEVLVASSADGRITQWSIRKGFEFQDLMKLKKMNASTKAGKSPSKSDNAKKGDALISRYVSAMCFDFHPNDGNLYLAGSEEGNLHKCSCSYNEQFLETFNGHTGPVYKVLWCPFLADAFITCSADWSIRLWHQDKQAPALTLLSAQKAVNDIDWSPKSPTVIGAVNDTEIEIWDLVHSTLDPLIVSASVDTNVKLTSIIFSLDSEAVLVGDSDGHVTVYQMRYMPAVAPHQVGILSKIVHANDTVQGPDDAESYENDNSEPDR